MDRLCVISGATGGIGSVIVKTLWRAGYSIIGIGKTLEKVSALQDWLTDYESAGQYGCAMLMDLAWTDDLWRIDVLRRSEKFRAMPLTLLVVCHGAAPVPGPAIGAGAALRQVIETDVYGTYELCALAGKYMLPQRQGSIVLVSSLHARQTYPERLPYCVAKASVCAMAKSLAVEWGQYGIRVNSILPWQTTGERSQHFADVLHEETGEDLYELYRQRSPMRRMVTPEDVANAVLFLEQNQSISGHELILDGALSSSMWYKPFIQE